MTTETQTENTTTRSRGVPDGHLGVNDLCKRFNVSKPTIYLMIAEGRLPKPHKSGRFNLWDSKDIDHWIKHGKFLSKKK